jgi:5-methylcytosine-specific restriction endonuclease McrA
MIIPKKRDGKTYNQWRHAVFCRDNYQCKRCESTEDLVTHHIIGWEESPSTRLDIDNGETLCRPCHSSHHLKCAGWNKGLKTGYAPWRGKKRSEETKRKLSLAAIAYHASLH